MGRAAAPVVTGACHRLTGAYAPAGKGLLAQVGRKHTWQIAEYVHATPDGLQHLLARAVWDPDRVRDEVRDYMVEHLGAEDGVLIVDETGFIKKGACSVGVSRQYTGTSGKVDNCQVAVFAAYASRRGRALVDRELYLPKGVDGRSRTVPCGRDTGRSRVRHQTAAVVPTLIAWKRSLRVRGSGFQHVAALPLLRGTSCR